MSTPAETDTALRSRLRRSWSVTYPLIVGSLSTAALMLVDSIILGWYGTEALATIGLVAPLFVFASALVLPWGTAVQILVARWHGSGERDRIRSILDVGLVFCLAAAALFTVVLIALSTTVVGLVGGGQAPDDAATVLRVLLLALPLTAVTAHYRGVFGGLEQTKITMRVALLVNITNIPLDYLFVFGLDLGALGSAVGTVTATATGAAYIIWFARRRLHGEYPFWQRANLVGGHRVCSRIWRIGWPDVAFAVMVYGADVLLAAIVARIGEAPLAGYRLMVSTVLLLWVVVFSHSSGIAILAGQRLGARDPNGALGYARSGALLMAALSSLIVLPALVVPGLYFSAFTPDERVIAHAQAATPVLLLVVPAMVVAMSLAGVLRAAGDTKGILYAGALSQLLLAVPLAWIGVEYLGWGLTGVYAGFATGLVARALFTYLRFRRGQWRQEWEEEASEQGST